MYSSRTIEHRPTNAIRGDAALLSIASMLESRFLWVDNVYAFARIIKDRNGDKTLATYAGNGEYIDLLPTGTKGNYIAMRTIGRDADNADAHTIGVGRIDHVTIELICFFDFRKVFTSATADNYTEENVVEQFREVFRNQLPIGMVAELGNVYSDPDSSFSPADLAMTDPILMRRPYGCISMEIALSISEMYYCAQNNN